MIQLQSASNALNPFNAKSEEARKVLINRYLAQGYLGRALMESGP